MKSVKIILLSTIFFFTFFFSPHTASASKIGVSPNLLSLSSGLVGYWTFDGKDMNNGVVLDKSGNGNHGNAISISTSTFYKPGKIGQGLKFDGSNDYINAGTGSSLDDIQSQGGGGMTVAFWIRPDTNTINSIIQKGAASNGTGYWQIQKNSTTNPARLRFAKEGGTDSSKNYNSLLVNNVWQHIVLTWDGSMTLSTGVVVYRNGVLQTNLSATDGATANSDESGNLMLGSANGISDYLDAGLDDVRIYNRILTQSEITYLYNMGAATKQASSPKVGPTSCTSGLSCGLVGYWTFDGKDMRNGVVLDKSGNGNNGNPINIASSTFYAPGKLGQAVNFDGVNDGVKLPSSSPKLSPGTSDFTIAGWMFYDRVAFGSALYDDKVASGDSASIIVSTLNRLSFTITDYGIATVAATTPTNTLTTGKWTHVIAVRQGTNVFLYINGVISSSNSGAISDIVLDSSFSPCIGAINGCGSSYHDGKIDDVRFYMRALSQSEITYLYNMGAATKQASSPKVGPTSCTTGLSCGLVGYWTFDGKDMNNGVVLDKSGNGNHGNAISISTSTFYVPGKIGQAGRFDGGDDYVQTSSSVISTTDVTISSWIYLKSFVSIGQILTNGSTIFRTVGVNKRLEFSSNNFTTTSHSGTNSLLLNTWYHVTVTRNNSNQANFYINGILVGTANQNSGTPVSGSYNIRIGAISVSTQNQDGTIDDVRIYNRALSASEVKQLYNL